MPLGTLRIVFEGIPLKVSWDISNGVFICEIITFKLLQPVKALPIDVIWAGIVKLVISEYPYTPSPKLVTLVGITVLLHAAIKVFVDVSIIPLHPSRESYFPLPSSTVILFNERHWVRKLSSMVVTDLGTVKDVR